MRKLMFFILLIPAIGALGHDIYIFTQEQDKGLRLSDVGALWDKYHKESHDQWKVKLGEINETINEITPFTETLATEVTKDNKTTELSNDSQESYKQGFTQTNAANKESVTAPLQQQNIIRKEASSIQKAVGFILEQTAIFVFLGFAGFIFLISEFFCRIFSAKTKIDDMGRPKQKGGKLKKYGRK